ncbi:MAG: penicillin-binding protein 2 [Thiomicrospira sp.]
MHNLRFDETQNRLRQKHSLRQRMLFIILIILTVFSIILLRMAYLQWLNHDLYYGKAEGNRVSVQPIAPARGKILDRNGVVLADNQPVYSLTFQRELMDNIDNTFGALQQLLPAIPSTTLEKFAQQLKHSPRHRQLILPYRLSENQAAKFAVQNHRFPGVTLSANLKRIYPFGESAVHLLGYVGRISQQDLSRLDATRYRGTENTGRAGIERFYEDRLQGYPGIQTVESNAQGRVLRTLNTLAPIAGEDITLSIDIHLQQYLENLLAGKRASVVAINPQNGEILAFVSTPLYDPNLFVDGIDHQSYNALLNDPNKPLINRALRGQYPPGSTTKPFLALGALEQGYTTMTERIFDPGYFEFQNKRYRNWKREGHGWTDLQRSIVESVDTLYYKLSLDMGVDGIHDVLAPFGFGQLTQIDLLGEQSGILPSQEWKRRVHGKPWYRGETIVTSIGQGYNLVTPLQLAQATAILANRGQVITPHLVVDRPLDPPHQVPIKNRDHWEYVIQAMRDVVHTPAGTAWRAGLALKNKQIEAAGKTGTAQVFSLNDADYKEEELASHLHDHALFIGFAPVSRPQIALSVIVENAGGGGRVAAPIGIQAMKYYLEEIQAP